MHGATPTLLDIEFSPSSGSGSQSTYTTLNSAHNGRSCSVEEQTRSDMSWQTEPPKIPTLTPDKTSAGEGGGAGIKVHKTRQPWSTVRWTLPPFLPWLCQLPSPIRLKLALHLHASPIKYAVKAAAAEAGYKIQAVTWMYGIKPAASGRREGKRTQSGETVGKGAHLSCTNVPMNK